MAGEHLVWSGATDGDWNTAGNWVLGVVPVAGQFDVYPARATVDVDGSDETGVALAGRIVEVGCSISLGTEGTPLQSEFANSATIQYHGDGEYYVKHKGGTANTITIRGSGTVELGIESEDLADDVYIQSDEVSVGIARQDAWTAQVDNIYLDSAADLYIGTGVTDTDGSPIDKLYITDGAVECFSPVADVLLDGSENSPALQMHAAISTQIKVLGDGEFVYFGAGTIANITETTGTVDFLKDTIAFTVTDCDLDVGAKVSWEEGRVTWTDGQQLATGCKVSDVELIGGAGTKVVLS